MAKKTDKLEKFYTPEEVAIAVLKKAEELIKSSKLKKNNTAHEIEAGEEPNNDDAEAPEYLANADIENSGAHGEKKKSKKPVGDLESADKDNDGDIDGDDAIESAEELEGKDLDGDQEIGEDPEHKEEIEEEASEESEENDEESENEDNDEAEEDTRKKLIANATEDKKQPMVEKNESCEPKMDLKKPSLKKFLMKRKMKKAVAPTADSRVGQKLSETPQEPSPAAKVKEQPKMEMEKNKPVEKLLNIKEKAGK